MAVAFQVKPQFPTIKLSINKKLKVSVTETFNGEQIVYRGQFIHFNPFYTVA